MSGEKFSKQIEKINATLDRIAVSQAEESKRQVESSKKHDEEMQAIRASQAESSKKHDEEIKAIRALQAESSEQLIKLEATVKENNEQLTKLEATVKETSRKVDEVARLHGASENTKGKVTEAHFYQYFLAHPHLNNLKFDEVHCNFHSIEQYEHDIVMLNGDTAAAFSVKYALRASAVNYLITDELPRLAACLKETKGIETIYLGVAGEYVIPEVQRYAEELGLFVLSQSGENTTLLNSDGFSPRRF